MRGRWNVVGKFGGANAGALLYDACPCQPRWFALTYVSCPVYLRRHHDASQLSECLQASVDQVLPVTEAAMSISRAERTRKHGPK